MCCLLPPADDDDDNGPDGDEGSERDLDAALRDLVLLRHHSFHPSRSGDSPTASRNARHSMRLQDDDEVWGACGGTGAGGCSGCNTVGAMQRMLWPCCGLSVAQKSEEWEYR